MLNEEIYSGRHKNTPTGAPHKIKHLNEVSEWVEGIYLIENDDDGDGGEHGLANLQAQELANRTQFLLSHIRTLTSQMAAVLNYLNDYTPDGAVKIRSVISPTQPENGKLWLKFDDTTQLESDTSVNVTLSTDESFDLFDGKTIVEVGGMKYALIKDNATISGSEGVPATLPPDTLPPDTTPSGEESATIWAGNPDIETLMAELWESEPDG